MLDGCKGGGLQPTIQSPGPTFKTTHGWGAHIQEPTDCCELASWANRQTDVTRVSVQRDDPSKSPLGVPYLVHNSIHIVNHIIIHQKKKAYFLCAINRIYGRDLHMQ